MNAVIFVYTIILILVCFAAAMFSLSAYAVSHKRSLLPQAAFFVFCIIEVTGILATEFVSQNLAFNMATYYEIPIPVLRIISGTGVIASLWVMLLDILDVHDRKTQVTLVVLFVLACTVVVWAMPYGPIRQWLFYTLRQVFIAFGLTYAYAKWRQSTDMPYRERLGRLRSRYLLLWALLVCILIEGKDNRAIANELILSEGTIKTHVHNIMRKTDTRTRDDLKKDFWAS